MPKPVDANPPRTSKAALIRRFVRERISFGASVAADPVWDMAGADEFPPADIDDVAYR